MCSDNRPLVSIVMGAYNAEEFISQAIESILNQTYTNIEFIIIDDCSSDSTSSILSGYAEKDKRIKIISNSENKGLGYSLSLGMEIAKGEFIARMDADDISLPSRLETQVDYLLEHPEVGCVGTSAKRFGDINKTGRLFNTIHSPESHSEIMAWLLLGTPMFHPSVMFNAGIIRKLGINYDKDFRRAQDYELWTRLVFQTRMHNIDKALHCYRYSPKMASVIAADEQQKRALIMQERMLTKLLGRKPTEEELATHSRFVFRQAHTPQELNSIDRWLKLCLGKAAESSIFDAACVKKVFASRRAVIYRGSMRSRFERLKKYYSAKELSSFDIYTLIRLLK